MKYLQGVAHGCWVVTEDWLKACLDASLRVSESGFEVASDGYHAGGARKVRRDREEGRWLLSQTTVCFNGKLPGATRDYELLVRLAGGKVVRQLPLAHTADPDALRVVECQCGQLVPVDVQTQSRRTTNCLDCGRSNITANAVLRDVVIVVADDCDGAAQLRAKSGRLVVAVAWLMNSLSKGRLLPTKHFELPRRRT